MNFFETIANTDFVMFLLGAFGVSFYASLHKAIAKCNSKVVGVICTILTYIIITWVMSNLN